MVVAPPGAMIVNEAALEELRLMVGHSGIVYHIQ